MNTVPFHRAAARLAALFALIALALAYGSSSPQPTAAATPLTIYAPSSLQPVFVGPFNAPRKFTLEVARPTANLKRDAFTVTVGGVPATVTLLYENQRRYVLDVQPPAQPANGLYDLTVSASGASGTASKAVSYRAAQNIDVMLVIDRSGSMSGTPLQRAKEAARLFVDQLQNNDQAGLVIYGTDAEVQMPLTPIYSSNGTLQTLLDDPVGATNTLWTVDPANTWSIVSAGTDPYWQTVLSGSSTSTKGAFLRLKNPITLPAGPAISTLSFLTTYSIPTSSDPKRNSVGLVQISDNGGASWSNLGQLGGYESNREMRFNVSPYNGKQVLLRFTLWSSGYSRWSLDDLRLTHDGRSTKVILKEAIDAIDDSGATAIGSGLLLGQEQLSALGNAEHSPAMVLLTDGQENIPPYIVEVLPTIIKARTTVHAVGLGSVDEDLLLNLAKATGGTYNKTPNPQDLIGIYNAIANTLSGRETLFTASGTASDTAIRETPVTIDSSVGATNFFVSWSSTTPLSLRLLRPDGVLITAANAAANGITYVSGSSYAYYDVPAPQAGVWKMQVILGASFPATAGEPASLAADTTSDAAPAAAPIPPADTSIAADPPEGYQPLDEPALVAEDEQAADLALTGAYQVRVSAASKLRTLFFVDQNSTTRLLDVTMPLRVSVGLSADAPILSATVAVTVENPLQQRTKITLLDDGTAGDVTANDGIYTSVFSPTTGLERGIYTFTMVATGQTTGGETFRRESQLTTIVGDIYWRYVPLALR